MARFYAACLASYNNGRLHGEWIDATADADEMQEKVNAMLRASPFPNVMVTCPECDGQGCQVRPIVDQCIVCTGCRNRSGFVPSAEEWCVHDYDDDTGLLSPLGETSDLKAIARLVETAELAESELGSDGVAIFNAFADHMGRDYLPKEPSEAIEQCREAYAGTFSSLADWAEQFLDDTGALSEVPDSLRNYIDFEAWARDAAYSGDVFTVKDGGEVHVFWNH